MLAKLFTVLLTTQAVSAQTTNSTDSGAINHGNDLYCTPTQWYDVFVFFVGNYISHALTVKSYPGESTSSTLLAAFGALLIPTTGLLRGMNSIVRNAKFKRKRFLSSLFGNPDYQTAAAAGALCMVVRKKSWKPYPGDKLHNVLLREESIPVEYSKREVRRRSCMKSWKVPMFIEVQPVPRKESKEDDREPCRTLKVYCAPWAEERGRHWGYTDTAEEYVHPSRTVHGLYDFKDQAWSYALAHVPRDAVVVVNEYSGNPSPSHLEAATPAISSTRSICSVQPSPAIQVTSEPIIAASFSIPKAGIAIVQFGYALVTLYQSKGNQINHFGYAAFALTVVPYALMSLVNLIGNMLTPDYQALYLVASDVMDEAIRRGARFDGVVGRLVQDCEDATSTAEVVPNVIGSTIEISYRSDTMNKTFPVSIVDYSSPPLPSRERRQYVKDRLQATHEDLSASVFVPSCEKFCRLNSHAYPNNINKLQMSSQGAFSMSSVKISTGWRWVVCMANAGVVLAIIGGLSRFQLGEATQTQLNWTMHWYTFGAVYSGFAWGDTIQHRAWPEPDVGKPSKWGMLNMIIPLVLYGIPAIGGFVVVVQMLFEWGNCTFS